MAEGLFSSLPIGSCAESTNQLGNSGGPCALRGVIKSRCGEKKHDRRLGNWVNVVYQDSSRQPQLALTRVRDVAVLGEGRYRIKPRSAYLLPYRRVKTTPSLLSFARTSANDPSLASVRRFAVAAVNASQSPVSCRDSMRHDVAPHLHVHYWSYPPVS